MDDKKKEPELGPPVRCKYCKVTWRPEIGKPLVCPTEWCISRRKGHDG